MADYSEAYKYMSKDEYSNPTNFLHKNKGEDGLTIGGLYQKWHPKALDWAFIDRIIVMCAYDMELASKLLFRDKETHKRLLEAFKAKFWDKNKLTDIDSQLIANKVFSTAVNIGNKEAVLMAQRVANVAVDGIIGNITIKAINDMDEVDFINLYIKELKKYYSLLIEKNPSLAIFKNGWHNRAERIV